jgi:hypothetical protein
VIEGEFSCAKKLARLRDELEANKELGDEDVVLIVDGYDVLFTPIFQESILVRQPYNYA